MKKFFKFAGSVTLFCAAVAGGIFAYKKFFAPDPFEDDFDDDPEESAAEETEISERGYVSLTSDEEKEEEAQASGTEDTETDKEASEETAEN